MGVTGGNRGTVAMGKLESSFWAAAPEATPFEFDDPWVGIGGVPSLEIALPDMVLYPRQGEVSTHGQGMHTQDVLLCSYQYETTRWP